VIWHGDPKIPGIVAQERWNREFERASMRRLLAAGGQHESLSKMARQVQLLLEHTFYKVTGNRVSAPSPEVEDVPMPDVELIRLLSLLAPDGQVLHVERVRRIPESIEEPCVLGCGSRQAPIA
jgi:hypothetical protein